MGSLIINFMKRAIIVPILITVLVIAGVAVAMPGIITNSHSRTDATASRIELSSYNTRSYDTLKQLKRGEYIGAMSSADFEMGQTAVVYNAENNADVYALRNSTEPWNKGGMIVMGTNAPNQLGKFHEAEIGDVVTVDFFGNDTYEFKIKSITPNQKTKDIDKYYKDNTLAVCVPYNDFSDLGSSYLYTIYLAEKI